MSEKGSYVDRRAPFIGVCVLTAVLATALELLGRSVAPFPYAPRSEDLAFSFLLYAASLVPAVVAAQLGRRFAGVASLLLGTPFGLVAVGVLFAGGHSSGATFMAAGLLGFPAGVCLRRVSGPRTLTVAIVLCLLVAGAERLRPTRGAMPGAPSVLFIVLDTTATGHLSAYGYPKPTTATLEALARHSLVYRRAVSPASWTIPAHASMFSGLYPSELGFDGVFNDPRRARGSLASDLEESGRAAYAISANPLLNVDPTLRAGYRALWQGDRLTRPIVLHLLDRLRSRKEFMTRADRVTDLALDWLDRLAPRGQPWFLFLNYIDPHIPYDPPRRERDEFAPGVRALLEELTQPYATGRRPLTPEVVSAMRELYDGEIAAMDRALGRLLGELERRGYDTSNLLLIISADHGEALGEHGLVGHMRGLPDVVLHVPLLLSGPGVSSGEVGAPVQTVQLRATVRACLGLAPLSGIAPALPPWGKAPALIITEHPEPGWYLEELHSWNPAFDITPWAGNWVAAERDGTKVVFDDRGRGVTFQLRDDPDENRPQPLTDGTPLTEAYAAWRRNGWDAVRSPSPEVRRALESMGYLR